jgi:exonuclease III
VNWSRLAMDYGYQMYLCEGKGAGVAVLIKSEMVPFIRRIMKSGSDGRMLGLMLETEGKKMLVVSVYMPTGLDHVSSTDPKVMVANDLYAQMLKWCRDADRSVLLGDFNETRSSLDRNGRAGSGTWLNQLLLARMTDVYRHLHPDVSGYSHFTNGVGGVVQSRLDYIWTCGLNDGELLECQVHDELQVSNHRVVYARLQVQVQLQVKAARVPLQLPNLRDATEEQKEAMAMQLGVRIEENKDEIRSLASGDAKDMNELADKLSRWTFEFASSNMKMTGKHPKVKVDSARLQKQRWLLAAIRSAYVLIDVESCW